MSTNELKSISCSRLITVIC